MARKSIMARKSVTRSIPGFPDYLSLMIISRENNEIIELFMTFESFSQMTSLMIFQNPCV